MCNNISCNRYILSYPYILCGIGTLYDIIIYVTILLLYGICVYIYIYNKDDTVYTSLWREGSEGGAMLSFPFFFFFPITAPAVYPCRGRVLRFSCRVTDTDGARVFVPVIWFARDCLCHCAADTIRIISYSRWYTPNRVDVYWHVSG